MEPIKTIEIQDIFKIPIYKTELSLDTDELEKACHQYKDNNKSRAISNVGGYQSNNLNLGNEYIFESLMDEIEEHTSNFAKYFINDNKQGVTNIWININGYKDYNKPHNHVNSEISGVYYVKAPEKSGNITFEHPAKNVLSYYNFKLKTSEWNNINSAEWFFKPYENYLYLFPSWLSHFVSPNENKKEERISLSFNTKQL